MANFLVTSPNVLTEGTTSNDLIVLQSAGVIGATVYANGGNDTISAIDGGLGANVILNGQAGADTIALSGVQLTLGKVAGGQDNDLVTLQALGASTISTIHGGKGADTITISGGSAANSVINGNEGHDLLTLSDFDATAASRISLGKGNDTINLNVGDFGGSLIGGGGNDLINGSASLNFTTGFRIEGDSLANPDLVGNDTITLSGTFLSGTVAQGGGGNDKITLSGTGLNASTVAGNDGFDSIVLTSTVGAGVFVGGGQGADTITILGAFTGDFGTVFGGNGKDVITVSGDASGSTVIGGAGADTISISDGTTGAGGINTRYTAFSESNLSTTDFLNIDGVTGSGGTFTISQTVVSGKIGASLSNSAYTTNSVGVATFTSTFSDNLTARVTELDRTLGAGSTVAFTVGNDDYIFTQAGAAGSGVDGDFVAQLSTGGSGVISLANTNGSGTVVTVL